MNRDRARYWVELGGAAYRIRALRGREALSRPFRFELDFHAEEGSELSQDGLVKSDATLRIDRSEGPDRTLDCIVTDVSVGVAIRGAPLVRVVLEHRLALARLRVDVRLFRDKTAPEIVEEVLAAHGVGCELRLRKGYTRRPYTVQQRESDFDFASRLLEDEGIFYACGPGGSIALGDGPKAYAEAAIALPFRPDAGLESPGDVVTAAGGFAALAPGRVTLRDWNAEKPSLDMDVRAGGAPTPTAPEFYDYPGEYGDSALGSDRAQTTAEAFQVAAGGYALKTDCARLAPGATLRILDAPPGVPEAELVVTAVAHDYDREGGGFLASLEALDATVAARPPRTTFVPTQVNPVTAFVTGPPGEDVYTDEYGRVKVHFHWDRLFPRDDTCSHWVPVLQDNTGQSSAIPRIGWEVLVHFLEGDPDRPVILGRVYNTADPFPVDLPAQKTHTSLRSLCSPGRDGFNEIKLEDKAGVEFFLVHAERDQTIIVANDKNEHVLQTEQTLVRRDQSITVGASSYITVSGSRSLDVLGNQTWSVGGNRKVVLGDAETHDVKASRALTVGGMHTRKIGDNDSVTAKTLAESVGGVILELSLKSNTTECGNALAVTVGGAIIDVSKGSNAVTAQLGRFETVGALAFTKAGGAVRVRADKTRTTTVGGLLKIDAAKDVTLTGGEEITLRATTASFSATDGPLTLKVGDTRVELKEGKITVDAKTAIKLSIHATNNQGADVSTRNSP